MTPGSEAHVAGRITAYLDGELSAAEGRAVVDHCAACERCARVLEDEQTVRQLLTRVSGSVPAAMWPAVHRRLLAPPISRTRWRLVLGGATAAALGLWLGLLIGEPGPRVAEPGEAVPTLPC